MGFLKTLSMFLAYFSAFWGVYALRNTLLVDEMYWLVAIILIVLSLLFAWLPGKRFDLGPLGFAFLIRGLLSLYVYFSVPVILFIVEAAVWLLIGGVMLLIPSKARKRKDA